MRDIFGKRRGNSRAFSVSMASECSVPTLSDVFPRLIGGETLGAVGIVQLLVMAQDVVKGVQQGEEQPGLAMVIPVIAGRARQVDVVDDVRRGT